MYLNALYILCNFRSRLSIRNVFESNNSIGTSLELVCPFHPTSRQDLSPSDQMSHTQLQQQNAQYFCNEICGEFLTLCGHTCADTCHIEDRNHVDAKKCRQSCRRLCSEGHPCRKACDEICAPCEWTDTSKTTLDCGHVTSTKCSTVFTDKCQVSVVKNLPCGHERTVACSTTTTVCDFRCDFILNCGHECDIACGDHDVKRQHRRCSKPCARFKLNCRHPDQHPLCNKVQ